jgi:hypothetical protein
MSGPTISTPTYPSTYSTSVTGLTAARPRAGVPHRIALGIDEVAVGLRTALAHDLSAQSLTVDLFRPASADDKVDHPDVAARPEVAR